MTDKEHLIELARQCEAADGPSRALDVDIANALGLNPYLQGADLSEYTLSIEAALALVPEGWDNHTYMFTSGNTNVNLVKPGERFSTKGTSSATPALALCAAALRAKAGEV